MSATAVRALAEVKVGNTPLIDVSRAFPELGGRVRVLGKGECDVSPYN